MPGSNKLQDQCKDVALPCFGIVGGERILAQDDLFAVIRDKYPVSPGHCLVVAKRPGARFHELTVDERYRLMTWINWAIEHLEQSLQKKPDGFNFGLNDGAAAGQTVEQLHAHVIPRYLGDVLDPRGGTRCVVPQKAKYWG